MDYLYNQFKQATMTPTNTNHPSNARPMQQVSTNIVTNNGTVNVTRYMDLTPSQTEDEELVRVLDQAEQNHQLKQARDTEKDTGTESTNPYVTSNKGTLRNSNTLESFTSAFRTGTGSPILHNEYGVVIRQNKTPYRVPYASGKGASVVTPQSKNNDYTETTTTDGTTTIHNHRSETTRHTYTKGLNLNKTLKIYHSALLDEEFKPTNESLTLSPELEPLRHVILSQHEGFTHLIKNLGHINISLTKIIEKKKDSLLQLTKNNKIPRSLQIKCELTTSAAYIDDPDFLAWKADLQQETSNFIQKGSEIMAKWTERNIQLLIIDRCSDILNIALQILDGLVAFYSEILGLPNWPSIRKELITLFFFKLYFSNTLLDTSEISNHLSLEPEDILLIGTKILTKTSMDDEATSILNSLDTSDADINDDFQSNFISEILLNFDQILRISTTVIWSTHKEKLKQTMAASNLKAKLQSLATINATDATANAINRATENLNVSNQLNLNTNLRISTVEKTLKRHEQRFNESTNSLKKQKKQKNFPGSHNTEPMASPVKAALKRKTTMVLDLTGDKPTEKPTQVKQILPGRRTNQTKRTRPKTHTSDSLKKSIQWREDEIKNFNPSSPAAHTPQPPAHHAHHAYNIPMSIPISFPPTHLQNTSTAPMYLPITYGQHGPIAQQQFTPQPYLTERQISLPQSNPFQRHPQYLNFSTRENPFGVQQPPNKN
jgi:hypothetical protein